MYDKITILGNLGRDPEMRFLPSGQAVTNMSVAANRSWTDQSGQKQKQTVWYRVSVWGNQAEACHEFLSQGSRVLIEGQLKPDPETGGPRTFTRNDGTVGASFEVRALRVVFASSRNEDRQSTPFDKGGAYDGGLIDEDDIDF